MKNFIRKYILFTLTVLGLLSGCETQETVTKDNSDIIKGMKFYEKSFDALFLETKFNQAFVKLPKIQIQNPTSVQSRNAIEDGYGFTIIPDLVRIVEKDDYTYYNFFVIKDTASYKDVNNFVIKLKDNGEMDAYLTKYKDILQAGNNVNNVIKEMQQVFSNRSLASSEVHCITFSQLMCNDLTSSGIYSSDHPFDIDACDGNHVYISSVQICFPNGSGGSEGSNGSGGTLGSSGGTGVHGGGTGDTSGVGGVGVIPIINEPPANTPPIIPVILVSPIIRNHYSPRDNFLALTPAQIGWINNDQQQEVLTSILQYLGENGYVQGSDEPVDNELRDFVVEIIDLARNEPDSIDNLNLIKITTKVNDNQDNLFEDDFITTLDPYVDMDFTDPPLGLHPNFGLKFYFKYNALRTLNPGWSKTKCLWEASKNVIHISLDAFGLIPVGGEVADLINGAIYTIEGDGLNATLSYASAIPIAGWASFSTKYAIKIKTAYATSEKVKLVWKVLPNNTIYFASDSYCRAQLRKVLGLAVDNPSIAHHIMPISLQANDVIQKAAKSNSAFHLNEALNGLALNSLQHSGSHASYTSLIRTKLQSFNASNISATPIQSYNYVISLIDDVKAWIIAHPNTNINLITLP